jgi:hypothetical protein
MLRNLLNHSYVNKKQKQSDYNAFVSRNLNVVKVYTTKEFAKAGGCIVAPYIISQGTIAPIITSGDGIAAKTNISIGDLEINEATTVGELTQAILDNNDGWQDGDQLNYISVLQQSNPNTGYPFAVGNLYAIELSLTGTTAVWDLIPEFGLTSVDGYIGHGASAGTGGFAWVHSRKVVGETLEVSTQSLIMTSNTQWQSYSTEEAIATAVQSYGAKADSFLSAGSDNGEVSDAVTAVANVSVGGTVLKEGFTAMKDIVSGSTIKITGTLLDNDQLKFYVAESEESVNDDAIIAGAKSAGDLGWTYGGGNSRTITYASTAIAALGRFAVVADGTIVYNVGAAAASDDMLG